FFQAEDGIRDDLVTGVQTCALPIWGLVIASLVTCFLVSLFAITQIPSGERASAPFEGETGEPNTLGGYLVFMLAIVVGLLLTSEIGRASCRERVEICVGTV